MAHAVFRDSAGTAHQTLGLGARHRQAPGKHDAFPLKGVHPATAPGLRLLPLESSQHLSRISETFPPVADGALNYRLGFGATRQTLDATGGYAALGRSGQKRDVQAP